MPRHLITYSMPWYSIIPVGLGVLMIWAFLTILNILGFTNCTDWKSLQSAPMKDMRVTGFFKNVVYLQAQDGTTYCNEQNRWQACDTDTWFLSHKDAPTWFNPWFGELPTEAKAVQLTLAGSPYFEHSYIALLEDDQIWSCPKHTREEVEGIMQTGAVIWLILPVAVGIACAAWFMRIFIQHGSPTLWDFWGRGTRIK